MTGATGRDALPGEGRAPGSGAAGRRLEVRENAVRLLATWEARRWPALGAALAPASFGVALAALAGLAPGALGVPPALGVGAAVLGIAATGVLVPALGAGHGSNALRILADRLIWEPRFPWRRPREIPVSALVSIFVHRRAATGAALVFSTARGAMRVPLELEDALALRRRIERFLARRDGRPVSSYTATEPTTSTATPTGAAAPVQRTPARGARRGAAAATQYVVARSA